MPPRRSNADWRGGWWLAARHCASPNEEARPTAEPPTLVVLHSISLPPGVFRGDAVQRLFMNTLDPAAHPSFEPLRGLRVSAHFLVRRDGEVVQFVDVSRRAWHAGVSAWRGRERCNDWSIGIELEGLEGGRFDAAQYRRLADLLGALQRRWPITEVVGHEHVAPGRKRDPGARFDWMRVRRALRGTRVDSWPLAAARG